MDHKQVKLLADRSQIDQVSSVEELLLQTLKEKKSIKIQACIKVNSKAS